MYFADCLCTVLWLKWFDSDRVCLAGSNRCQAVIQTCFDCHVTFVVLDLRARDANYEV